uniref:Uncharacterized protein n=1 Tax=Avena sativa TaxID=4498 RepID=A0ACD5XVM9_AVESA
MRLISAKLLRRKIEKRQDGQIRKSSPNPPPPPRLPPPLPHSAARPPPSKYTPATRLLSSPPPRSSRPPHPPRPPSAALPAGGSSERGAATMGVHLSTPKTEKCFEDGEGGRVRYGLASMQGWRTTMEDAHAALPELDEHTSFFGVFDGHGGKSVSKFCAKYLHVQVLTYEAKSPGDLATAVKKAYFRIDEMMKGHRGWRELNELGDKGQKFAGMLEGMIWSPKGGDSGRPWDGWSEEGPHSDFEGPTCGSTACVAIIRNDQLVVANAGDSRCVISRKGQAHDLSRDHKPDLATERERIKEAGGFVVAGRVNGSLNLTRAIGDMELKTNEHLPADRQIVSAEPEVKTVQLSDDDEFIVLACDGIWYDFFFAVIIYIFYFDFRVQTHLTIPNMLGFFLMLMI